MSSSSVPASQPSSRLPATQPRLGEVLAELRDRLADLERWTDRLHREEALTSHASAPNRASPLDPGQASGAAEAEELARRALQVLLAAQQHAAALLAEARATSQHQLARARSLADEMRAAASVAADQLVGSVEEANAERLRTAEQRAEEALAFAWERVAARLAAAPPTSGIAKLEQAAPGTVPIPDEPTSATTQVEPEARGDDEASARVGDGLEVGVGPFARFSDLAAFVRALRGLPGVRSIDTRQFYKGTVTLRVHYDDSIPLATRVAQLEGFSARVVSATPTRLEVRVEPAAKP